MMRRKMLIPWSFFVLLAFGKSEEIRTDDYELKIENGTLTRVKELRDVVELDLSNLGISGITSGAFENVTVKSLNLGSNKLSELGANVFSDLGDGLEKLNLASNQIQDVTSSFVGLVNLKLLNFSYNPTRYLHGENFAGIPQTADILLKGNSLVGFDTNLFGTHSNGNAREKRMTTVGDSKQSWRSEFQWTAKKTELHGVRNVRNAYSQGYGNSLTLIIQNSVMKKVSIRTADEEVTKPEGSSEIYGSRGTLDLRRRGIESVAKGWYQLPDNYSTAVFLWGNDLTEITPELINDLPEGIKTVYLSSNSIEVIKNDVMNNVHIEKLQLSRNLIKTIEDRAFQSLINLRELSLRENKLKDVSFAVSLPGGLGELDLSANELLQIPAGAFSRFKNLTRLLLNYNKISIIRAGTFQGLESLSGLELSGNKITEIEGGAFVGKPTYSLKLDKNQISNISPTAFEIDDLEDLDLDNNLITDFNEHTFRGLNGLKRLWLRNNNISEIRPGTMKHMNSLERLGISYNPIVELRNGAFFGIPKNSDTKFLTDGNNIEIIQGGIFEDV